MVFKKVIEKLENEKIDILVHLIVNGYLTKNQIKAIIKRGN